MITQTNKTLGPATSGRGPRRWDDHLGSAKVALTGTAWLVFLVVTLVAQPAPDPSAPVSVAAELISLTFLLLMLSAAFGLAMHQRWALHATLAGGVTMAAAAILCFATGHTGAWIAVQFLAGVGLATTGKVLDRF